MVGAAFITERLAASVQLLNKTSQPLLHTMYSQKQTRAAQAAKSFTPYHHSLYFFLEISSAFRSHLCETARKGLIFSSAAIISAQTMPICKSFVPFFPDVQKK